MITITDITTLKIHEIAAIIRQDWIDKNGKSNINYAAKPYVDAMDTLENISDKYICDDGKDIVARFLCNANSWRGEVAKIIKEELKKRLKK